MPDLASLLQKYNRPGPRYTSYPTAPAFHAGFTTDDWREALQRSRESRRGISLYAHIPFCDTLCYYCGCNMVATGQYGKVGPYLERLEREMATVQAMTDADRRVEQLHWGGGTPTFLRPDDIGRLMAGTRRHFDIAPDAEMGCEADPRGLTREHLEALRAAGFNRISFGVQDLDPRVQQAINRVQPPEQVAQVIDWARASGFSSINLDLIIGLPHQTVAGFDRTLDTVIGWAPDRLAVFAYAHVPWMKKHQRLIPVQALPDAATRLALGSHVADRLSDAGYVDIGLDHYARPDDELVLAQRDRTLWRNFQGYTTHKDCDILAFGASSISQTPDAYAQSHKSLRDWGNAVTAIGLSVERGVRLTRDDQIRRDAITRVMCDLALDGEAFGTEWGIETWQYFAQAMPGLTAQGEDGLLAFDGAALQVTPLGRRFLRNIAMCFDRYLQQDDGARPRYSRTA